MKREIIITDPRSSSTVPVPRYAKGKVTSSYMTVIYSKTPRPNDFYRSVHALITLTLVMDIFCTLIPTCQLCTQSILRIL